MSIVQSKLKKTADGLAYDFEDPYTASVISGDGQVGIPPTSSLFAENLIRKGGEPIYTIFSAKTTKHKHLPSAKDIYLSCDDPTEYEQAMKLVGSFENWERLCKTAFFKPIIAKWRKELEMRLRSAGFKSLMITAAKGNNGSVGAAKYLADKGWDKVDNEASNKRRGRPSKQEIEETKKAMALADEETLEDAKRLGLH